MSNVPTTHRSKNVQEAGFGVVRRLQAPPGSRPGAENVLTLREALATLRGFLSNENNVLDVVTTGMEHRTPGTKQYAVTYAFDEDDGGGRPRPIERIRATARAMKRDKLVIGFLGAIQVVDEVGRLRMVTARYEASTQGVIGLLNCRSELPACGAPQIIETDASTIDRIDSGAAVEVGR